MISVIKLQNFVVGQIALQIFFSMGLMIFIQHYRILQPWYANHIETFNEACVVFLSYIAISFTDLNGDLEARYDMGLFFIATSGSIIAAHLVLFMIFSSQRSKLFCRKC